MLIETVTIYSTPKLQPPVFSNIDEIKHEEFSKSIPKDTSSSEEYLSNDPVVNFLRNDKHEPEKSGADGYIFNENLCKLIKKRVLCGYDRNQGEISDDSSEDIGNNCVKRNDRIECGYLSKPFNNSLYLRFKRVTVTESSSTTISNEIGSLEIQGHKNIYENLNTTTEVPVQFSVLITSESTTYAPKTPERSFKEIRTVLPNNHQLKIAPDTILLKNSSLENSSSHISTVTTVKVSNPATLPSLFIDFVKNLTTSKIELPVHSDGSYNETYIETRNKTENVRQGLISKLMNNIENKKKVKSEKHIELIPPSKNCKCPYQATNVKYSSTSAMFFLRTRKNSKSFRKGNDKTKIKTSCVENNDRIVCVDYKLV